MRRYLLLFFTILFSIFIEASAQNNLSGKVSDANLKEPLPGVTVYIKGGTRGTITDVDGSYNIGVNKGDTLVFSFIGYKNKIVPYDGQDVISVSLSPDVEMIDEVVVTTVMGLQREKKTLGYATQEIKGDVVSESGEEDISQALQGKIAGVTVRQNSGMPGAGSSINIRGASSLLGNNQPLYVIDGVPVESGQVFNTGVSGVDASSRSIDINPDDIESVNVLKGASAAALYGLRASNGVVVINTKSGKDAFRMGRKTVVTLNTGYNASWVTKVPEVQQKFAQGTEGKLDLYSQTHGGPESIL